MGSENPIHTLGDYFKPSHDGYRNTIELLVGNNVVPLRSDTIRLVQNRCSFYELWSKDPNQHLKDFLKLVDSLDFDGSITAWEDLTTPFLAQFFPPGRTAKLHNDILMFQQHHDVSLRFVDSFQRHNLKTKGDLRKFSDIGACPSLDVSLGDVIGPKPPIKPHSPDSSRMKVVDYLKTQTPPSPHVPNFHPKGVYSYYNSGIDDPKRHYGFKPGLLGKSVSLGVDISNWEMFDDDWRLESKEVSPLIEELSLFDRPNKVERGSILEAHHLESILQQ
uniref:Zinc finger, CCHC-type n=1 Tax=Tanacetum cinerariifolium TaxID=118510 RepID=A0A6L2JSW3_TANCI|nr:zinc finger, CCHC-type [Tanacetum cinerariifolium]